MSIDYQGMGEYYNKSDRTIRRMEKDNPVKFELMLEEYEKVSNTTPTDVKVIAAVSFKGGPGKSTILNALGSYIDNAVILNLDLAQPESDINSCPTIDYSEVYDEISVSDLLDELSKKYKYILIDTPGEISDEFLSVVHKVNHFIVPFGLGKRIRNGTISTMVNYLGSDNFIQGDVKIFFVLNRYNDESKAREEMEAFKDVYRNTTISSGIKISSKISSLKSSDAIATMENEGKSHNELHEKNRAAYRVVSKNLNKLCLSIEEHFEL